MNTYKSICLSLLLIFGLEALAQDPEFKRIESLKTKFITEKLDLSPEEAQKFWPVYNAYRKELEAIHGRRNGEFNRMEMVRNWEDKTEEELQSFIRKELNEQKRITELKLNYLEKFNAAVGQRKAATYYRIEVEFHRKLMGELRKRRPRPDRKKF